MEKMRKSSKIKAILFLNFTFFVYSLVSVFSKLASSQNGMNVKFIMCYGVVLFLLMLYALLWQQNLKRLSLVTAYSNKSVTVIWGLLWGVILYQEKITLFNIIGAIIIIIGVCIMASDSEEES